MNCATLGVAARAAFAMVPPNASSVEVSRLAALAPRIDAEIARNLETAARLGVTGTPSWVVGDRVLSGALPVEELKRAIAAARAGR